ncbi:hypothetical protein TNCV_4206411 [Trichonephila clavipes]|nr:hypothetical protein TNCV_4206411 [Trichonephila clavipes]
MMLGMAKVVFSILLSGMMAIGRAMESGRRGYGSSSGWKVFEVFLAWLRTKRLLSDWMLSTVNIDSDWLPQGLRFKLWGGACLVGRAGEKY